MTARTTLVSGVLLLITASLGLAVIDLKPALADSDIHTVTGSTVLEYIAGLEERILQKNDARYVQPTGETRSRMKAVVRLIGYALQGDDGASLQIAAEQADNLHYQVVRLIDRDSKTVFIVLRETENMTRGWGFYVFTKTHVNVILEAPHPLADSNTSRISAEIFVQSKSRALLVAGAHRDAAAPKNIADVAHEWNSIFQAVHEETVSQGSVVIQMHSFSRIRQIYEGYPDVVLSSGTEAISGIMESLTQNLRGQGFRVGMYDGFQWTRLSAKSNVQGIFSRRIGAQFVHVEVEFGIVESAKLSARLAEGISRSIDSLFTFPLDVNWKIPTALVAIAGLIGARNLAGRIHVSRPNLPTKLQRNKTRP